MFYLGNPPLTNRDLRLLMLSKSMLGQRLDLQRIYLPLDGCIYKQSHISHWQAPFFTWIETLAHYLANLAMKLAVYTYAYYCVPYFWGLGVICVVHITFLVSGYWRLGGCRSRSSPVPQQQPAPVQLWVFPSNQHRHCHDPGIGSYTVLQDCRYLSIALDDVCLHITYKIYKARKICCVFFSPEMAILFFLSIENSRELCFGSWPG